MPLWSFIAIIEADALDIVSDLRIPSTVTSSYTCYRYWPGPGSHAIKLVIRSRWTRSVKAIAGVSRVLYVRLASGLPESLQ
jgi:hypothetical protein